MIGFVVAVVYDDGLEYCFTDDDDGDDVAHGVYISVDDFMLEMLDLAVVLLLRLFIELLLILLMFGLLKLGVSVSVVLVLLILLTVF